MTADWGGAQWVLATALVAATIIPPPLRFALIREGFAPKRNKTWTEFWGWWFSDLAIRIALVAVLAWGGFW